MTAERDMKIAEAVRDAMYVAIREMEYVSPADDLPDIDLRAILATIPPEPVAVPEGWKKVAEAVLAGYDHRGRLDHFVCDYCGAISVQDPKMEGHSADCPVTHALAMLAAAPTAWRPAQEEQRECINEECRWFGPLSECVHPKHDTGTILCPECHDGTEVAAPQAGQTCPYCDGTGDVHRADGEWMGRCTCAEGKQPAKLANPVRVGGVNFHKGVSVAAAIRHAENQYQWWLERKNQQGQPAQALTGDDVYRIWLNAEDIYRFARAIEARVKGGA